MQKKNPKATPFDLFPQTRHLEVARDSWPIWKKFTGPLRGLAPRTWFRGFRIYHPHVQAMEFRHLEGVPQPDLLWDFTITMVINHVSLRPGMILQVGKGGWMVTDLTSWLPISWKSLFTMEKLVLHQTSILFKQVSGSSGGSLSFFCSQKWGKLIFSDWVHKKHHLDIFFSKWFSTFISSLFFLGTVALEGVSGIPMFFCIFLGGRSTEVPNFVTLKPLEVVQETH